MDFLGASLEYPESSQEYLGYLADNLEYLESSQEYLVCRTRLLRPQFRLRTASSKEKV